MSRFAVQSTASFVKGTGRGGGLVMGYARRYFRRSRRTSSVCPDEVLIFRRSLESSSAESGAPQRLGRQAAWAEERIRPAG